MFSLCLSVSVVKFVLKVGKWKLIGFDVFSNTGKDINGVYGKSF